MVRAGSSIEATIDTTPGAAGGAHRGPGTPGARRRVEQFRGLPGSRAIVGGLLVAAAGVSTLVAWQRAAGAPGHAYVVAARPIPPGESLEAGDVRLEPIDLPPAVAGGAFTDAGSVVDRVALGPIGEGELVQAAALSDPGGAWPTAEVSLALDRDRAVDGHLRTGDVVDVFVTYDDRTEAVAERVQVVAVSDTGGASFTSGLRVTVTLAIADPSRRAPLIHAARVGEVTLVRSTHLQDQEPGPTVPALAPGTVPPGDDPAVADDPAIGGATVRGPAVDPAAPVGGAVTHGAGTAGGVP